VAFTACNDSDKSDAASTKVGNENLDKQPQSSDFNAQLAEYKATVDTFLEDRGCSYNQKKKMILCEEYPVGRSSADLKKDRSLIASSLSPEGLNRNSGDSLSATNLTALDALRDLYKCLTDLAYYSQWYDSFLSSEARADAIAHYELSNAIIGNDVNNVKPNGMDLLSKNRSALKALREDALTLMVYILNKKTYAELWAQVKMIDALLQDQTEERELPESLEIRRVFKEKDV
jgi:hypothetical protein